MNYGKETVTVSITLKRARNAKCGKCGQVSDGLTYAVCPHCKRKELNTLRRVGTLR